MHSATLPPSNLWHVGGPSGPQFSRLYQLWFLRLLFLGQKQCGKREGWKTPLGWPQYQVLSVSTWEGTLVAAVLSHSACRARGRHERHLLVEVGMGT